MVERGFNVGEKDRVVILLTVTSKVICKVIKGDFVPWCVVRGGKRDGEGAT